MKNNSARILLILLMMISCNLCAQEYWSRKPTPVNQDLQNCFFINGNTGWAAGDSGTVIRTTDGGNNWELQNTGTDYNIQDIYFINSSTGWALAWNIFPDSNSFQGTIILKTTNGGDIWTSSMYPDTNSFMKSVFFKDAQNGYLGGVPSSIVYTTNSGQSWNKSQIDSNLSLLLPVLKIKFFDNNTGYACGGFRDIGGIVWVTTNTGLNWTGTVVAPEPFFDMDIIFSNKVIMSGGDLEFGSSIARTTNTGMNWFYDTLGVFGLATGISFRTPAEVWMTGSYSQKFLISSDSGNSWNSVYTPDSAALFDIEFPDTNTGYACGEKGSVYKYDRTSTFVTSEYSYIDFSTFRLQQNFPNPFNPVTEIRYEIEKAGYISLKVYDMKGSEIKTLRNEYMTPGVYKEYFSGNNLPSGVYFLRIENGGKSGTVKMILIR
ncbi:MAG: T9SS type A sorting domain-containing protein [Bacteroidetes bacterium]|nr:T9SS type A sorting domain-containing protein [Bacteroidota bacterium]